jgi:thiol-disulfide isomerase/thioredoxin
MGGINRLREWDFYRQLPKDLAEGSTPGGVVSIVGSVILFLLFTSELLNFVSPPVSTVVVLDQNREDFLKIDFNITFPHLPCRFAEVDVDDVLGTHERDLHRNIRRIRLDGETGHVIGKVKEAEDAKDDLVDTDIEPLVDEGSDPPEHGAVVISNTDEWLEHLQKYRLVFIDYYVDWCHWCKALEPHWERAAAEVHKQFPNVLMAKVDCESDMGRVMCRNKRIQGYPTMLMYRNGNRYSHEMYNRQRTVSAIVQFVKEELSIAEKMATDPHLFHQDVHDQKAKYIQAEGCRIYGHLYVKKVPGNFHFTAKSNTHSIAASKVDLQHTVHHLAFGDNLAPSEMALLPAEVLDGHEVNRLDTQVFSPSTSPSFDAEHHTNDMVSYEHYLRVISSTFDWAHRGRVNAYRYTVYSQAAIQAGAEDSDRESQEYGVAHAFFRYDFSPLGTLTQQKRKAIIPFLVNTCAIIGGLFTTIGITLSMGTTMAHTIRKKTALGVQD